MHRKIRKESRAYLLSEESRCIWTRYLWTRVRSMKAEEYLFFNHFHSHTLQCHGSYKHEVVPTSSHLSQWRKIYSVHHLIHHHFSFSVYSCNYKVYYLSSFDYLDSLLEVTMIQYGMIEVLVSLFHHSFHWITIEYNDLTNTEWSIIELNWSKRRKIYELKSTNRTKPMIEIEGTQ